MRISTILATLFSAIVLLAANPPGVPKEAKQTGPGEYKFTDSEGKNWVFRQTPFGIQKGEDKAAKTAAPDAAKREQQATPAVTPGTAMPTPFGETKSRAAIPVRVTESGDNLQFERQTPFGPQRWTRSKSELTDQEKQIWEAHRNSTSSDKSK